MKVEDEKWQERKLHAGRDDDETEGVTQGALHVELFESRGKWRFEEPVAVVGARYLASPRTLAPKERLAEPSQPTRARTRIRHLACRMPRADVLQSFQQRHRDDDDSQHGEKS